MLAKERLRRDTTMMRGLVLFILIACVADPVKPLKIYESLTNCYRGNNTIQWTASTLQNLLELIRKVEQAYSTSIDMRMLSVSIIHRLRIDGIQKASGVVETDYTIPYGVGGKMVPRFQLLLNLVSDTPNPINFTEVLTPTELCTFHRLVSSTIETSVRGDEVRTCSPNLTSSRYGQDLGCVSKKVTTFPNGKVLVTPGDVSNCPQEYGVIRTLGYGSVSPGTIIGAIAAGLQPQVVPMQQFLMRMNKDAAEKIGSEKLKKLARQFVDLNNNFVAGIAGDLAEVCVYQAPYYGNNVTVGFAGYWDDLMFPKARYLTNNDYYLWQLTDSEVLAGIDAYHFSMNIKSWVSKIQTLRLSQVLEMYYSPKGVPIAAIESVNRPRKSADDYLSGQDYKASANMQLSSSGSPYYDSYYDGHNIEDNLDSACERKRFLERISSRVLKEETFKIAQLLQLSANVIEVDEDLLYTACGSAVDRFFTYARLLLDKVPDCKNIPTNPRRANVDLTMIIDGSQTVQQAHKLAGAISELIDVSSFGSFLSVIHGGSSETLVSRTNSVFQVFQELQYYDTTNPTSFSLSNSLSKVVQMLSTYESELKGNDAGIQRPRVVLVISQGPKITDDDFKNADWLLSGSLQHFHDVYYVFVTKDRSTFEELSSRAAKASYLLLNQYVVIESSDPEPKTFIHEIEKVLRQMPKILIVPKCSSTKEYREQAPGEQNRFEDYVSPNHANTYFLSPASLQHVSELRIKFEGVGYGSLTVCMARVTKSCQSTNAIDLVQFNITHPCQSDDIKNCTGITFTVEVDSSKMRCTESDCRYPDQVRYVISFEPIDCHTDGVSQQRICDQLLLLVLVIILFNVL